MSGSRVNEGHHDVACALCGGETLVVVCEATWVQQRPALSQVHHAAVVAEEATASTLRGGGE